MSDHTDLAARLRQCHAAAFHLDKPAWIDAPDHERERWRIVADRYRHMLHQHHMILVESSGWWLYFAWDIDGYAVPWTRLSLDRRNGWIEAARTALARPERIAA